MPKIKKRIIPCSKTHNIKFRTGIYEILHRPTSRRYVGSSSKIEKRIYWHLIALRKNKHHCGFLQNVWNKYGESQFEFFLLETCTEEMLAEVEQKHMDSPSLYTLMNTQPLAKTSRGYKHSEESRKKMSEAAKLLAASQEERDRRSARCKKQHEDGVMQYRKRGLSSKICVKCGGEFEVERWEDGTPKQSRYCLSCRPKTHKGGYYKFRRMLEGEGKPKARYPGV